MFLEDFDLDSLDPENGIADSDIELIVRVQEDEPAMESNRTEERQLALANIKDNLACSASLLERMIQRDSKYGGQWDEGKRLGERASLLYQRVPGNEGFGDFIRNKLLGVANIMGHIINLVATGIFSGWRDFKRSGLEEEYDSNVATYKLMFAQTTPPTEDIKVPVPQGMEGDYRKAIGSLQDYMRALDMYARVKTIKEVMSSIRDSINRRDNSFTRYVADANRSFLPKGIDKLYKQTSGIFTPKRHVDSTFGKCFIDLADVEYCVETTLTMDAYLKDVASVHSHLQDIEEIVKYIVDNAQYITNAQADDLAKMIRMFAETFDQYATVINDIMRVNHNLVFVMKRLRKFYNM